MKWMFTLTIVYGRYTGRSGLSLQVQPMAASWKRFFWSIQIQIRCFRNYEWSKKRRSFDQGGGSI